ncbi:MAG: zinc dependent phospholipase C family protein [Promethearchaeota archaeon]
MATWVTHFRIAENILNKYPNLNRNSWCIASIAPDCGLPNDDWSAFTPPKEISHFTLNGTGDFLATKTDKFILSDIKFFSRYLMDSDIISPEEDITFLLGYFIHLVTDNLWNYFIMKPLKEKYIRTLQKNPRFIWDVKRDWYDLDKIYITENKDSLFWTDFLKAELNKSILGFFPIEGIQRQLEFIKKFYQISKEEYLELLEKDFVYMKNDEMDNFIQNSTEIILMVLKKIRNNEFDFNNKISVLDDILIWS